MRAPRTTWLITAAVGLMPWASIAPAGVGDQDNDGVNDEVDVCDNTPAGTAIDQQGRPLGDLDLDCDTDLDDFTLLQQGFTGPLDPPLPPGWVIIPDGAFQMGCHAGTGEDCWPFELPVHDVLLDSFYLDIWEVTNAQFCEYLNSAYAEGLVEISSGVVVRSGGPEPYCDTTTSSTYSRITWDGATFGIVADKEDHPMVQVSWYGAAAYANWRSDEHNLTPCYNLDTWACNFVANGYRLPTEAEWEYASRGGAHDPYLAFPMGNTVDGSQANYFQSGDPFETGPTPYTTPVGYYDGNQTPIGQDMANGYGLYDMAGNVWEWCNDWYDAEYYDSSPTDNPRGPASGTERAYRGGAWNAIPDTLRAAMRTSAAPGNRASNVGFRLAARH